MTIIGQVRHVCFSINAEQREGLHHDLLNRLKALFINGGYKVHLEYPIHFKSRVRKSGDYILREGNLDLVAIKNGRKIAVEFDAGIHLRYKSIEKLLQANADLCIGIIKGRCNILNSNIDRIKQVIEERGIYKKNFWLIIITEKIIKKM